MKEKTVLHVNPTASGSYDMKTALQKAKKERREVNKNMAKKRGRPKRRNPAGKKMTKEDIKKVFADYRAGDTWKVAAKKAGLSAGAVLRAAEKFGMKSPKHKKVKVAKKVTKKVVKKVAKEVVKKVAKKKVTKKVVKKVAKKVAKEVAKEVVKKHVKRAPTMTEAKVKKIVKGEIKGRKITGYVRNPKEGAVMKYGTIVVALAVSRLLGKVIQKNVIQRLAKPAGLSWNDTKIALKAGTEITFEPKEGIRKFFFNNSDLVAQGTVFIAASSPWVAKQTRPIRRLPGLRKIAPKMAIGAGLNLGISVVNILRKELTERKGVGSLIVPKRFIPETPLARGGVGKVVIKDGDVVSQYPEAEHPEQALGAYATKPNQFTEAYEEDEVTEDGLSLYEGY